MRCANAGKAYFFDYQYFYNFLENNYFETKLLLAKKEDVITAGAIFTIPNRVMQYYLAGTYQDYIKETPMKLILDKARLLGNELGLSF